MQYITSPVVGSSLIEPHGGKLINRMCKRVLTKDDEHKMGILKVSKETIMDAEQIAIGAFSPLEGFLGEDDFNMMELLEKKFGANLEKGRLNLYKA